MQEDLRNVEWVGMRERFMPKPSLEPKIDLAISKIVGKKIYQTDPRLLKLVIKWKGNKPNDSTKPDNFLQNPEFIKELRKVMETSL